MARMAGMIPTRVKGWESEEEPGEEARSRKTVSETWSLGRVGTEEQCSKEPLWPLGRKEDRRAKAEARRPAWRQLSESREETTVPGQG